MNSDFYPRCPLCKEHLLPGQIHKEVEKETHGFRIHIGCYGRYRLLYKEVA